MAAMTKQCLCVVLIPFILLSIYYTILNFQHVKSAVFDRSVLMRNLCPISTGERNQKDYSFEPLPYTTKKVKNWKNSRVKVKNLTPQQVIDYFYWTNGSSCNVKRTLGTGLKMINPIGYDGQKAICLDPIAWPYPAINKPDSNDTVSQSPCLIYSFGISNEWSFDEAMERTYGCEVFSFDPSMNKPDHDHSQRVHFYNLGLGQKDIDHSPDNNWTIKTLKSIYQMLLPRHGEKVIDYLKIDIESAEWNVLPQIIESGMLSKVRQLGVEFHVVPRNGDKSLKNYQSLVGIIKSLEGQGMVRFDSQFNPWWRGEIEVLDGYEGPLGFEIAFYQHIL